MSAKAADAYTVLLREKKLPMSLLLDPEAAAKADGGKPARARLLTVAPFKVGGRVCVYACVGGCFLLWARGGLCGWACDRAMA